MRFCKRLRDYFKNRCARINLAENWPKIGQKLDKNWTKIGRKLGENWTKIGRKLDKNLQISTKNLKFFGQFWELFATRHCGRFLTKNGPKMDQKC